ncbi:MAG: uroporphyrinogen-III C-methyltransferase [Giesbergeria sp.]|uniref:uroporphyrinogen-III C-methyltransferase n=1 Tax=Giesbergeria sp. TaxID=2818473 RepID=UPI00261FA074|nr:uroporphyrinogen-III C-methyltransferase [Giesbergeria sp.]MDD2609013.1 uroporphyrinogen-III C-methyltransferase [Giesbergeria sp.]
MSSAPAPDLSAASPAPPGLDSAAPAGGSSAASSKLWMYGFSAVATVAVVGLTSSTLLWQKLNTIQEQLARQSADASTQAVEARTLAREAQEQAGDAATRLTVAETRLNEVALQRGQLEELMRSLSRSRDETLVVDIEAALRLAEQQAQFTGQLEPLLAALKSAQQRIERAAQPRLVPVQRAIGRDAERLRTAQVTDTAGLLARLDDAVRQVDELPLQNAVATTAATRRLQAQTSKASSASANHPSSASSPETASDAPWWQTALLQAGEVVWDEVRSLVRVSRIDQPEAILLAPEQAFFLRENLKLKLLNARLGIVARQLDSARTDLAAAHTAIQKYFDPSSRRTQQVLTLLQQSQLHLKNNELPRLDETFAALGSAAAGR